MSDAKDLKLIQSLRNEQECEWLEFKKNYNNPQEIGEYLSALSNSALLHKKDHGYLIFGIQDKSLEIVGTSFSLKKEKRGKEELENWLTRGLVPATHFRYKEILHQGKKIAFFEIEASTGIPVAFYGEKFIRVGSYKKNLKGHPEKEKKIWGKGKNKKFETEISLDRVDKNIIDILDYPEYFRLMGTPTPSEEGSILERLEEDKIIFRKDHVKITNLGALLFARDLKKFENVWRKKLRIIVYNGQGKINPAREVEMPQGYASGFDHFMRQINSFLPAQERIKNGLREEGRVYPEIALRELLINMLVHQDFEQTGTGPMVEIFNDRIEFSNPGSSLVNAKRCIDHRPVSRNEILADIMRRMNIGEERGIGIDKVIAEVEKKHLPPPKFVSEEKFFVATLYGPKKWKDMGEREKREACYQHCCLRYVLGNFMTNQSLLERFNLEEGKRSIASEVIADSLEAKDIKCFQDERSSKTASYIPFWA